MMATIKNAVAEKTVLILLIMTIAATDRRLKLSKLCSDAAKRTKR